MHVDDAVLEGLASYLRNIPGLEDHITLDEETIPAEPDTPWCWLQLGDFVIDGGTIDGKKYRSLEVHVDLIGMGRRGPMKAAGTIAAAIEDRIDADPRLGGLVRSSRLVGGTRERDDPASAAHLRLTYSLEFATARGAATTPI